MSRYAAGRRAEWRTMRVMEAAGYVCTRSSSSKGPWDVVAVSSTDIALIQVKQGKTRPGKAERDLLLEVRRPPCARVLLHYWPPRSREPEVEEL